MADFPGNSVEVLAAGAHDPAFFNKLASDWNIAPRNVKEGEQLLELALMLREAKDNENVKSASDGNQFLSSAIDNLKLAMGEHGIPTSPTADVASIKNAAAAIVANPEMQKAALDYGAYLVSLTEAN